MNPKLLHSSITRYPGLGLFVLGVISSFALPPYGLWWLLGATIPTILFILEGQATSGWGHWFTSGWALGFGYFVAAMHWIGAAFFVDAARDLWMMPIALGGLSAFLAIFWGVALVIAMALQRRGHALWLALPGSFAGLEWLRGNLFSGFPWSVFGQVADGMGPVEQLAALLGMTGLTFMVWLWGASVFGLWREKSLRRVLAACTLLSLPLAGLWGQMRLDQNPTVYRENIVLRLVQPNISQNDKWREGNARRIFDQLLALTAAPSSIGEPVTHIIWPESSVPFLIDESDKGRGELAAALQPAQILIAGAVRRAAPSESANYYTSILVFDGQAHVLDHYDKWHLVPGGEFLPMSWLLEPLGLRKVVSLPESFTAGLGPATLNIPGAGLAGMSICYEAIFPGAVAGPNIRPNWLVNVTNDGWFGTSSGPYQHLAQLRLRSIELGVPAARAANTGISAIIDGLGRKTFTSQIGEVGAFDLKLPQEVVATIYSQLGDFALLGLLLLTIFLGEAVKKR